MIEIRQRLVPGSRTSTGSLWEASTAIGGKSYSAVSRHGAPMALARVLIAAGIPDQLVIVCSEVCVFDNGAEIRTEQVRGGVTYRSLHAMAKTTFEEGNRPLHRARFKDRPQIAFPLQPSGQESVSSPPDDVVVIREPGPAFLRRRRCVSCHGNFEAARQDQRFCCSNCRLRAHRAGISRSDQPGRQAQSAGNAETS
jgi:hypothetical protein